MSEERMKCRKCRASLFKIVEDEKRGTTTLMCWKKDCGTIVSRTWGGK